MKTTAILSNERCQDERYVPDFKELASVVACLKKEGKTIVLSSGVYDMIHNGHGRYLELAKQQGDILIVGVDSDALTKDRKGPSRPIVPEGERIEMLLHLRHVDLVTIYNPGSDNFECIEHIKPDVIVISETTKDIKQPMLDQIEKYNIKKVILPAQSEVTSTGRIRQLIIDGGKSLAKFLEEQITKYFEGDIDAKGGTDGKQ